MFVRWFDVYVSWCYTFLSVGMAYMCVRWIDVCVFVGLTFVCPMMYICLTVDVTCLYMLT